MPTKMPVWALCLGFYFLQVTLMLASSRKPKLLLFLTHFPLSRYLWPFHSPTLLHSSENVTLRNRALWICGFSSSYFEQLAFNVTSTEITASSVALFSVNPQILKDTRLSKVFRRAK